MRVTERELLDLYDTMLNEVYGDIQGIVTIAGYDYLVSDILKAVDPIAYRTGFNDWTDAEGWIEDGEDYIKE